MANEQLGIRLVGALNMGSSIKSINDDLKILAKHPSLQKLKIKIDVDQTFVKSINSFIDAAKKLNSNLDAQNKVVKETINEFRNLDGTITITTNQLLANGEVIEKSRTKHDANKKAINEESKAYGEQRKTLKELEASLNGYEKSAQKVNYNKNGKINSITNTYKNNNIGKTITVNTDADGYVNNYVKLSEYLKLQENALKHEQNINKERERVLKEEYNIRKAIADKNLKEEEQRTKDYISNLRKEYEEEQSLLKRQELEDKTHYLALQQNQKRDQQYTNTLVELQNKINNARDKLGKNPIAIDNLNQLETKLKTIKNIGDFKSPLTSLSKELKETISSFSEVTKHAHTFGDTVKKAFNNILIYSGVGTIFYGLRGAIESGVQYVIELDGAMTDLRKVTDETGDTYTDFIGSAEKVANSIGGLTINVIKSTTEWARLGYTLSQAKTLAQQTLVYQNVGDIDSAEEASTQLIASIKGFGIQVDAQGKNIQHVVDVYNEVGNKFAISTEGIGEAVQRSASSLSAAGNTLEESVAMITAANSVVQDPAKVGNALKTVSMRIRGVSEDGEDLSALLPTLEKKFANIGLTLKKDDNTFKNTYEIFSDLSKVWSSLNDIQQADILELVAGKQQGNIVSSMLSNWKDAQDSLQTALNSTGSAARENEKYLNSIQGKINLLKNALDGFWTKSINSSLVKAVIGFLTNMIEKMDNLGNVVILLTGLFLTFKAKAISGLITSLGTTIKSLFSTTSALQTTTTVAEEATIAMSGLQRALGWLGLAVTGFSILYSVLHDSETTLEKQNKLIEKTNKKYDELGSQLSDVQNYYKQNYDSINKDAEVKNKLFELQNQLVDSFGSEAKGIDLVNGKYDEQISKLEELNGKKLDEEIKAKQIGVDSINQTKYSIPSLGSSTDLGYQFKDIFGEASKEYSVLPGSRESTLELKEYYNALSDLQEKIINHNTEIFSSRQLIPKTPKEWANALNTVSEKLEEIEPLYQQINELEDLKKKKIAESTLQQTKLNDTQKQLFTSVNAITSKQPLESYSKNIEDIIAVVSKYNGKNLADIISDLEKIPELKSNPDLYKSIDGLRKGFSTTSNEAQTFKETINSISKAMKTLESSATATADEMNKFYESIAGGRDQVTLLNEAQAELKKNGYLSIDTLQKLTKNFDGFTDVLGGGTTAILSFLEAQETEAKGTITAQKEKTQALIQATYARIQAMQSEIEAIDTLNSAQNPDDLAKEKISSKWVKDDAVQKYKEFANTLSDQLKILDYIGKDYDAAAKSANDADKSTDKFSDSTSDTVEVLTELQKKLEGVKDAIEALNNKQERMKKGSQEYRNSLREENKLLQQQIDLNKKGIKDPSQLVSTKITTTTKTTNGSDSVSSGTGVDSLITNAHSLQGKFTYKQVSGEFKGTYDEFVDNAISDCSQFVQEMYKQYLNVDLPRTAAEQAKKGTPVKKSDLQSGDLVYFNTTGKSASHVGIYTGNGKFIQMGNSGLKESDLNSSYWADKYEGARRIVGSTSSGGVNKTKTSTKGSSVEVKTDGPTAKEKTDAAKAAEKENQDLLNQIYQNNLDEINDLRSQYDSLIQIQEDKKQASQDKQATLDPTSAEWRQENSKQMNIDSAIQGLRSEAKAKLKDLLKEYGISSAEFDRIINQFGYDNANTQIEKMKKLGENLNSQLDSYDSKISDYGNEIDVSNAKLSNMVEGSAEYRKELLSQIPIIQKQQDLRSDEIKLIQQQLENDKLLDADKAQLSDRLQQLTLDYENNAAAIKNLNKSIISLANDALSSLFDTLKESITREDVLNIDEFNDSIDSIIASLDAADKSYLTNVSFVDTTSSTRSSLADYASKVKDIANQVKTALNYYQDMSTVTFGNLSSLGSQINAQMSMAANLKSQLEDSNNQIRDTEALYKKEEAALENNIKLQEEYYDAQIKAQQDKLDALDEEYSKEDRIASLKEANDNLDKALNDKRYSYITENGEEILTYNKEQVDELTKTRDDLVQQYEREDVKNAIQDEIDRLEDAKQKTIDTLNDELEITKEIHQANLDALQLYQSSISSIYDRLVTDTQDKLSQFQAAITKGLEDGTLSATEGTTALEMVVTGWQSTSLANWQLYILQIKEKIALIKSIYADLASAASSALNNVPSPSMSSSTPLDPAIVARMEAEKNAVISTPTMIEYQEAIKNKKWDPQKGQWVTYHTGGYAGQPPLKPGEVPAVLKEGELTLTEKLQQRLKSLFEIPLSIVDNVKPIISNSLASANSALRSVSSGGVASADTNYYLSDFTIVANNPMELFQGIKRHINSR
ncbi:phage tail tape measure protein [Paenibacillus spiritus]|uniref:Phage tail tape measure protein n=1 Tax=Paenibacillus spiritus TaxID=2496557 RepID=A0A5J5GIR3_9BACL|nr:phage tail tape measure protein [Paenibacillus spiritus]KAA9007394.1 phage tail tape measure protein [Paenibacillus spiritus]